MEIVACNVTDGEIRQSEGFKNVNLGNVVSSTEKSNKSPFVSDEDFKLLEKFRTKSFDVQVPILVTNTGLQIFVTNTFDIFITFYKYFLAVQDQVNFNLFFF
jgi:hypothetical protein